jgi:hypothetical protein
MQFAQGPQGLFSLRPGDKCSLTGHFGAFALLFLALARSLLARPRRSMAMPFERLSFEIAQYRIVREANKRARVTVSSADSPRRRCLRVTCAPAAGLECTPLPHKALNLLIRRLESITSLPEEGAAAYNFRFSAEDCN